MRLVGAALLGLVLWGFAAGASAQNGLQRFESDIKPQLEVKKFTYGSASALGSAGFVLNDVVAVIPGGDSLAIGDIVPPSEGGVACRLALRVGRQRPAEIADGAVQEDVGDTWRAG